jgi:uroporphyrinogen decarboxylase
MDSGKNREPPTVGKPLLRSLRGEIVSPPPIWLMRQAGRYLPEYRELRGKAGGFLDLCLTPELAAEATLQPIRRFGLDAAILFSDILIVPHGLGQQLEYRDGEGPVLAPIRSIREFDRLDGRDLAERVAPVWRTVKRVKAALDSHTALIGFAGAPWTVAAYMVEGGASRDFAAVKGWAVSDPQGFATLIDRLVEATILYLRGQVTAGADAIQLFDSWAGVLCESEFRRWVIEPTRKIVTALRTDFPDLPIIGFPRGAGLKYAAYFRDTGVTALSFDPTVPLGIAHAMLQAIGPVQGNLDPVILLEGGVAMARETAAILENLCGAPFIFNLGHGVLPNTPPYHVRQLVAQVRGAATE